MKPHEIAQLVNELTKVAKEFHGAQQLRERISQLVVSALALPNAQPVVTVPVRAAGLSGDSAMAHQQCCAVVRLALAVAEVYVAKASIVAHDESFTDQIGSASAAAMEWLGDELNSTDAATEDDEWIDQIFEAAQDRWPVQETTGSTNSQNIESAIHAKQAVHGQPQTGAPS